MFIPFSYSKTSWQSLHTHITDPMLYKYAHFQTQNMYLKYAAHDFPLTICIIMKINVSKFC